MNSVALQGQDRAAHGARLAKDDFVNGRLGKVHTGMPDAYVVQNPE